MGNPDVTDTKPWTVPAGRLYTIGHSIHPSGHLIALLKQHDISVVADVRTTPHSRYNPQHNRTALRTSLRTAGIDYLFLGRELGGRPDQADLYSPQGHVLYGKQAGTDLFQTGIGQLTSHAQNQRTAVMCSEEDPADCHRYLLITRYLHQHHVDLTHIRGNGTLQTTDTIRTYWNKTAGIQQPGLFDQTDSPHWQSSRPAPTIPPGQAT